MFIGQDMNESKIKMDLDECLITEDELDLGNWKMGYDDNWPVERVN